jgi:hypothetical protein
MLDSNRPSIVRHANGALDFTDSHGTLWTVSEIARLDYSERLMAMLPHLERRQGWLLFESGRGDRRRYTPVPDEWRSLPVAHLERCLDEALPANTGEHRRRSDEAL